MMELIKWLLFFLAIAKAEGLGSAWKFKEPSNSERIMQTILETCNGDDHLPNLVVILGNYDKFVNKFIDKSSFIQIDVDFDADGYKKIMQSSLSGLTKKKPMSKASKIILIECSISKTAKYLQVLRKTGLWNHMAPFFIIGTQRSCKRAATLLYILWKTDILNAIYICQESGNNEVALFIINPITNYAPYPWKFYGTEENATVFWQIFDQNISCWNLNYDKTKFLDRFEINILIYKDVLVGSKIGKTDIGRELSSMWAEQLYWAFILGALNATGVIDVVTNKGTVFKRFNKRTSDIYGALTPIGANNHLSMSLFPHDFSELIAIVKLKGEVSTLYKILHIWSPQVLILAAISLSILFLILVIKDHDFGLALLDLTRLLTYTSVLTNNRRRSFRIYFTTMLIFMVISNGVFQGVIASFLTKEERGAAVGTINKLLKLGYKFKVPHEMEGIVKKICPKCHVEAVPYAKCVDYVLNSTGYACTLQRSIYETIYISLPLDYVKEPLFRGLFSFKSRLNFPLHNRFDGMIMKFFETGLIEFDKNLASHRARLKRLSMEVHWNSGAYRPVRLYKLTFAFKFLALGLSISTVVFIIELLWAKYVIRKQKKLVINHMGIRT